MHPIDPKAYASDHDDADVTQYNTLNNWKTRILIVDDDYDIALTLKMGLEGAGYEVDLFTDPRKLIRSHLVSILCYW